MRLFVVVLAVLYGCSPEEPPPEPPAVVVVPPPLPPPRPLEIQPVHPIAGPRSAQSQEEIGQVGVDRAARSQESLNQIRESSPPGGPNQSGASLAESLQQTPRRLVFECSDGVRFAVRMLDTSLWLYAPGLPPGGYLSLARVPSASGVHYRVGSTHFRSEGDLATLEIGRERYVDCVANPAAAVWEDWERPDTTTR